MAQNFGNAFLQKPSHKSGTGFSKAPTGAKPPAERKLTFTKIIRWRLPDGQTQEPATVEVVGTFTNWQKTPLIYDRAMRSWQVMLRQPHASLYAARGWQTGGGRSQRRHGHSNRRAGVTIRHCDRPRSARLHAFLANEVNARPADAIRD
jgi:hypothetical protein